MKRSPERLIAVSDLRGGRNDTDPPLSLRADQAVEMLNVDQQDTTCARKRGGATSVSLTGGTAFSSSMSSLFRHVPGASETAAELWGIDTAATPLVKVLKGGTSWADVTLDDNITDATPDRINFATLNGKLFIAYASAVNRLHVYDPTLATPRVRRVAIAAMAAPTVANTGAGAYAAVLRYYRTRALQLNGTTVVRRSEPSASFSFTPSGAGAAAQVTRATAPGEGETHWEVEASTDNATFYRLSQVAIATTTYDDSAATTSYSSNTLSDPSGYYASPFGSAKYLLTDGNRLLMAGDWSSAINSRVWFTPVLGSSDQGDDERVPNMTAQKNWVNLNENDGGFITALGGPVNGIPIAFKYRQVWKLRPTGDVSAPYLPRKMRDDIGCVTQRAVAVGEDQTGREALYFLSHRGPYRITSDGAVEYLGRDNEVTWRSMNLAATNCVACSVYYPDLHQWWLWIATGSENDPDVKMVFDVQKGFPDEHGQIRGGWFKHTGGSAVARSAVLFSNTLGATMSRDLKPYISRASGVAIWKLDTTDLDDAGTDFQAYIKTRPMLTTTDLGQKVGMAEPFVLAKALTGVTLTLTTDRDFGAETRTHTALLTASGTETRVVKKFEGGDIGEADAIQVQIGDGAAQEGAWSIDALVVPVLPQERK